MKMLLCKIYKFTNPEGNCNGLKCQCRLLMCSESRKMSKTSDENAMTETSTGAKILMPAILENLKKKVSSSPIQYITFDYFIMLSKEVL